MKELYRLHGAFYAEAVLNPLSSGQIALWHALVYINNKCRWEEWFTVPSITLVQLSGLSAAGVKKARNELKQRGLIDFRSNSTRATSYRILDITMKESSRNSVQDGSRIGSRNSVQDGSRIGSALKNINKNKNENEENISAVADIQKTAASACFGAELSEEDIADSLERDRQIEEACKAWGLPCKEGHMLTARRLAHEYSFPWLQAAIERSGSGKEQTWRYVEGILRSFKANGGPDQPGTVKRVGKQVGAQQYQQRHYTEEELLAVSDDLLAEARSQRGGTA